MSNIPFRIGGSGHQNLGEEATQHFVAQQFRDLLSTYREREHAVVFLSALAKGADQLFVQIALELGIPVEIVLPCAEYETIFSTEAERCDYHRLLLAAQKHHYLPSQHCSDAAFLAAGQWIVDQSDLVIAAWNGLPPQGQGGTGDVVAYARFRGRPFVHVHTRHHLVKTYQGNSSPRTPRSLSPKREFTVATQHIYQGTALTVKQHRLRMPDGKDVTRDVVEMPESILVLPVYHKERVLLIKEYNFGAGTWQLTLPGGKVEHTPPDMIHEQVQRELRQETGYRANRLEKIMHFYSRPGYVCHPIHAFVAQDLEWDPLDLETHEEIHVHTSTLQEALEATVEDDRFVPEAALLLWIYAKKMQKIHL